MRFPRSIFVTTSAVVMTVAATAWGQFEQTEVSGPGATPFKIAKTMSAHQDLAPTVPGVTYNVYRRLPGDGFRCIDSNRVDPTAWNRDPQNPSQEAWWYTVVADDTYGENLHGNGIAISAGARCPCSGPPPVANVTGLKRTSFASGFTRPVFVAWPPGDRARAFVVEEDGVIRIVKRGVAMMGAGQEFIALSSKVRSQADGGSGEEGLLSMAFHPDYTNNGRFFVYYNDSVTTDITVEEYRVSPADPDKADPTPVATIYTCPHPTNSNHNGGQLQFGSRDGKLYIGTGDGGSGGDPLGNGQNTLACLGKLHRLDVDIAAPYIPADNPFVSDATARPEIWSYGLRNPWRFSFDRENGDLYIGDVGQGCFEEIDVAPADGLGVAGKKLNFGWNAVEGLHCYPPASCAQATTCPCAINNCSTFTPAFVEYPHGGLGGNSVTGGYVYRGCRMPGLAGTYIYGDYQSGRVWSIMYPNPIVTPWTSLASNQPSSFGQDPHGEVYIVQLGGTIYRIEPQ